jgi:hypothetical protein
MLIMTNTATGVVPFSLSLSLVNLDLKQNLVYETQKAALYTCHLVKKYISPLNGLG